MEPLLVPQLPEAEQGKDLALGQPERSAPQTLPLSRMRGGNVVELGTGTQDSKSGKEGPSPAWVERVA